MNPDELHNLLAKKLAQLIDEGKVDEDDACRRLQKNIPELSDGFASILYKSFGKRTRSMLRERRREQNNFERQHYLLWKEGLDRLETYLVVAYELGENFNGYYRSEAAKRQDYLFDALTRLQARSVHVGSEVLCLLRSGFADGAHARWRTAHELAVVATFLVQHGEDVAKRYLKHEAVESYKAMLQYQEYTEALSLKKVPQEDEQHIKKSRDILIDTYGKSFGTQYGWAADALKKERPNFFDIEKATGMDHIRPYYKMASHNVHANPKGIQFRLGLAKGEKLLLAGPSNYGLADPAQNIAVSILKTTTPLLGLVDNIDSIVMEKLMARYVDEIIESFVETQQQMDEYDESLQSAQNEDD
ncbi:MAG: hypothetical protein D3919_07880 [Candidatus Electrothrix sp. AW5]|nr:hypothetical protein [Candidatus Electrothrix gigas]